MSKKNKEIHLIILNWNGFQDTFECLTSVQKMRNENIKITVVDNGSTEDDYNKLFSHFPDINLIRSDKNLGFSGGNNLGIKYALDNNSDFILLLNNDTIVEPDFLEPLLKIFEDEENVGIVSPQINYYNEPKKIWSEGGYISKIRGSGFAYSDKIKCDSKIEYGKKDFVSGCCMLIKKDVFQKIGLFDENYFLYLEDADLCVRTTKSGFNIFISNKSRIYHKVSKSTTNKFSELPLYYVTRNRLFFIKKNYPKFTLLTLSYLFFTMIIKSFFWIINGSKSNVQVVIKSFSDFFKNKMGKTDHNKLIKIK